MEEKDDVLDNLFDKKEDDDLFNLEDKELKRLDAELGEMNDQMDKFINEEIPPQTRDNAREHLREYSNLLFTYLHRENQLFYKIRCYFYIIPFVYYNIILYSFIY